MVRLRLFVLFLIVLQFATAGKMLSTIHFSSGLENKPVMKKTITGSLTITSKAFTNNGQIPSAYTCDGKNISPEINIEGIPEGAETLAIIVDDPDAPNGIFTHWVMWNITPQSVIKEGETAGMDGLNSFNKTGYKGPCPPSGTHRYFFKVFALDIKLQLNKTSRKEDLEQAMEGHIISSGELIGLYERNK